MRGGIGHIGDTQSSVKRHGATNTPDVERMTKVAACFVNLKDSCHCDLWSFENHQQFLTFASELPRQIQTSKWSKAPETKVSQVLCTKPGSNPHRPTPIYDLRPNIKKSLKDINSIAFHLKVTHPAPRNVFQTCASSPFAQHVLKWYAGRAEICECVALAPELHISHD